MLKTTAKVSLGVLIFRIRMPRLHSQVLLGSLPPKWRPGFCSELSPNCQGHLGSEPANRSSFSAYLSVSFKIMTILKQEVLADHITDNMGRK